MFRTSAFRFHRALGPLCCPKRGTLPKRPLTASTRAGESPGANRPWNAVRDGGPLPLPKRNRKKDLAVALTLGALTVGVYLGSWKRNRDTQKASDIVAKLLEDPSIRIRNVGATHSKIQKIIRDGVDQLHVICDYDGTISRFWTDDTKTRENPGAHRLLSDNRIMGEELKIKSMELVNKYYPIERDVNLTLEQKIPAMVEWWKRAHELVIGRGITKEDIKVMVKEGNVVLRPGLEELIRKCAKLNVPFLVFSAGVADVIEEVLATNDLIVPNLHIVSNKMSFDPKTGKCNAFVGPLIHVFNKRETAVRQMPYHQTIENRANVILLGDSTGDLQMASGIEHRVLLTIGFLNDRIDTLLDDYQKTFDVVVIDDGSMSPANWILDACIQ